MKMFLDVLKRANRQHFTSLIETAQNYQVRLVLFIFIFFGKKNYTSTSSFVAGDRLFCFDRDCTRK